MRRRLSASTRVSPFRRGTSTLPLPTATTTLTDEPFSSLMPAAGDCSMTLPAGAVSGRLPTGWLSTSSASRRRFSTVNVSLAPMSWGTLTSLGSRR